MEGHGISWKVTEGYGRSRKVIECHGRSVIVSNGQQWPVMVSNGQQRSDKVTISTILPTDGRTDKVRYRAAQGS